MEGMPLAEARRVKKLFSWSRDVPVRIERIDSLGVVAVEGMLDGAESPEIKTVCLRLLENSSIFIRTPRQVVLKLAQLISKELVRWM